MRASNGRTLNEYGDRDLHPLGKCGFDISSQRLNELDRGCIEFIIRSKMPLVGVDLGCGLGVPGVLFAALGARMTLVDKQDLRSRFATLASLFPSTSFRFLRRDLRRLTLSDLKAPCDFIYSQRALHYLRYTEAVSLMRLAARALRVGGRAFVSVSGLSSEIGTSYPTQEPQSRFAPVAPKMAAKHNIHVRVCLYSQKELPAMCAAAGLNTLKTGITTFGNIWGIFQKQT